VVHINAGIAGLVGALMLGKRVGYGTASMAPHNLPLVMVGASLLWVGWFGFNVGSGLESNGFAGMVFANTILATAAAALAWSFAEWIHRGTPTMLGAASGAVAGLVAITAGCNNVSPTGAVVLGLIAGVIVVFSVLFIDRIGIDDPVGAISVHGVCGAWGTLAAGIFDTTGTASVTTQLIGIAAAFLFTFSVMWIFFKILSLTVGLRVSAEEEVQGLDATEHGNEAYAPDAYSVPTGGVA